MMETEKIPKMLVSNLTMIWLITSEDFSGFTHCKSLQILYFNDKRKLIYPDITEFVLHERKCLLVLYFHGNSMYRATDGYVKVSSDINIVF